MGIGKNCVLVGAAKKGIAQAAFALVSQEMQDTIVQLPLVLLISSMMMQQSNAQILAQSTLTKTH